MPLAVRQASRFRRDIKRMIRQGVDLALLETIIETLVAQAVLHERHRDHALIGNWKGYRECHIEPNWLLIYRIADDELELVRTGSHSELFGR
jgi:mRNA interferase YafQ